jgi:hypothetical protein
MRSITKAAMKAEDGSIFFVEPPLRYSTIIKQMVKAGQPTPIKAIKGFLDNEGKFVSAADAFDIALNADQIITDVTCGPLFPEDIFTA